MKSENNFFFVFIFTNSSIEKSYGGYGGGYGGGYSGGGYGGGYDDGGYY